LWLSWLFLTKAAQTNFFWRLQNLYFATAKEGQLCPSLAVAKYKIVTLRVIIAGRI